MTTLSPFEIQRRTGISAAFARSGHALPNASEMQREMLADITVTPEHAQAVLDSAVDSLRERSLADVRSVPGDPGSHELQRDLVPVLLARAGHGGAAARAAAKRSPMHTISNVGEVMRMCLQRAGIDTSQMNAKQIAVKAMQTTGDFPILLENLAQKSLSDGYKFAPVTWRSFCREGSVTDFREHGRYRTGSLADFSTTNEAGNYEHQNIPDGEKGTISAESRGAILSISFQSLVNDDLGAFLDPARDLGMAAGRTVENTVFAILAENAGLGPNMGDGKSLFHADHNNISTAAALSAASIEADRVVMASQTDVSGNQFLDLRPSVWLGPLASGGTARVINDAQYDPDTANKLQKPNIVRGLFGEVVDSPRLSGARYYLFSDPNISPVLEVAFLNGESEPLIVAEEVFSSRGAKFRATLDFGVAAIDHRGAVTNAGA